MGMALGAPRSEGRDGADEVDPIGPNLAAPRAIPASDPARSTRALNPPRDEISLLLETADARKRALRAPAQGGAPLPLRGKRPADRQMAQFSAMEHFCASSDA